MQSQKSKNWKSALPHIWEIRFPKYPVVLIVAFGLVLPTFGLAQGELAAAMPQTIGEAKDFAMAILAKLPEATLRIWKEEALPVLQRMWNWAEPTVEPWRQKLFSLLGKEVEKRRPDIEQQFQEEKQEMRKDLWEKFKSLLRQSI